MSRIVVKSKGKFVVKKKKKVVAPVVVAKPKEKLIKNIPDTIATPKANQAPINNNPQQPPFTPATQPIVAAQKRQNPFRRSAALAQEND